MFSFPVWQGFPSVSLPATIQRRFLSFILKRTLGHLVRPGQLDPAQIDAQIGDGLVHVNDVELNHDAVNEHLAKLPLPFLLEAGTIGKVSARIPWPNVLTAPLALSLSSLSLTFVYAPRVNPRRHHSPPKDDLAESVTSMAESFVHDELSAQGNGTLLEDICIDNSRDLQPPGSIDPFLSTEDLDQYQMGDYDEGDGTKEDGIDPSAHGISLIATFIERLLARFEFDASDIRIRVVLPGKAEFTLHLKEVTYRVESTLDASKSLSERGTDGDVRIVKMTSLSIFTRDLSPPIAPPIPSRQRSVSPNSSSSSEKSEDAMMGMSQSLTSPPPPPSVFSLSPASTMYHSAMSSLRSSSPESAPRLEERQAVEEMIVSLAQGSESITFRIVTPQLVVPLIQESSAQAPGVTRTRYHGLSVGKSRVTVTIGPVAIALNPVHARSLVYLSAALQSSSPVEIPYPIPQDRPATTLEVECHVKCVTLLLLRPPSPILDSHCTTNDPLHDFFLPRAAFSPSPRTPHLRIQLDGLEILSSPVTTLGKTPNDRDTRLFGRKANPEGPKDLLKASISDFSIFAVTSSGSRGHIMFPVLVSDSNLSAQYDRDAKFPSFNVVDWTKGGDMSTPAKMSQWRVRPPHKRKSIHITPAGAGPPITSHGPILQVRLESAVVGRHMVCDVDVAPLHVFVDVGIVEGAMEFLWIASAPELSIGHGDLCSIHEDETSPATPRVVGSTWPQTDNETEKKKLASLTTNDFTTHGDIGLSTSGNVEPNVVLRFAFLRFEVRVPTSPASSAGSRSGAVVLDMRDVQAMQLWETYSPRRYPKYGDHKADKVGARELGRLQFARLLVAVTLPGGLTASTFLSITAQEALPESHPSALGINTPAHMHPTPAITPSFPFIYLRSNLVSSHGDPVITSSGVTTSFSLDAQLPMVHVKLSKSALDGLTFWADDMNQCLYGDIDRVSASEASRRSRDPSMIGSRFFVKRAATSTGSSESGEEARKSELVIKVSIKEAQTELLVPRENMGGKAYPLDLKVLDIDLLAEFKPEGRDETVITLGVMDIEVCDTSAAGDIITILGLTISRDVKTASQPFIKLRYISVIDSDTAAKESRLKLTISGFTYFLTPDIAWIEDLISFAKAPEGAFESVIPSERTRVSVKVTDGSFHVTGLDDSEALVAYIGELELSTELIGDSHETVLSMNVLNSCVFFIDDRRTLTAMAETIPSIHSGVDYWKQSGFALLAEVDDIELRLRHLSLPPINTQIHVDSVKLKLHLCADSIHALGTFSDKISCAFWGSDDHSRSSRPTSLHVPHPQKRDDFAAVDEHAFRLVPDLGPAADMIRDDLPSNFDYLDASFGAAAGLQELREDELFDFEPYEPEYGRNTPTAPPGAEGIISNIGGETIRMLDSQGIRVIEGHFENIPRERVEFSPGSADAKLSIRVHNCCLMVSLYDGYDWVRTRQTIEREIKAIRRRLVKIRQLLASGQTPDDSIEETSAILFNSVSIGLTQDAEELEPGALIAAIDQELGDDAASENTSSWQSFEPRAQQGTSRFTGLRGKTLERSRNSQIDFCLFEAKVEIDQFHSNAPLVSRVLVTVKNLEILDHIKTSTWRKFLTELHTDFRGDVRETASDMVRGELRIVHPVPDLSSEEGRLRVKVLPIKLHVDQDALDFMKNFFSFQAPGATPGESVKTELYFQHVEVFPVDIKLDYKPKRVDYKALREGRTIELMNFFHFEGAEITLRHITLSGISGWPRLFDTLNDLWTPDVKANQLADIISGVSPVRSLVNVGAGVADLVLLPIEQYKKDKRVVRGVQKGTTSFVKSTAMEALKLGARLATGTQVILEQAENVLGGQGQFRDTVTAEALQSPYVGISDQKSEVADLISKYADQPQDVREGVHSAYRSLSKNFNAAAQTILAVPMEVYERSGDEGPVRAIVRAVPIAVLKPMIGASEAVSKTLFGLRNTMDPEVKRENEGKYKRR